jgi:Rieske Fe-S protein
MPDRIVHEGEHALAEAYRDTSQLSRRRFLGLASGALGVLVAAALGIPLAGFYIGNVFRPKKERWLKLGSVAGMEPGEPKLFHSSYIDLDGWRQTTRRQTAYAVTADGHTYTVFSSACTHLGCPVHWDEQAKLFLCPCHGGAFSLDGKVVQGPPPRPLGQLKHRVEDGTLFVHVAGA